MKKVLIIGAKGLLGPELVRVFKRDEMYDVTGWDVDDIDIGDKNSVNEKVIGLEPDIIINAAAYNAVDKAEEPEGFEIAKRINGMAPGYLADAASKIRAIIVHYSTDYVFDGNSPDGYDELSSPNPISKYGESKYMGEMELQRHSEKYYLIRLQKMFGKPSNNPNAKKSFFETMLNLAKKQDAIKVVDDELSNFTYAPDLAGRTKYLIDKALPFGIYHITNEGMPVTWYGAAKILFELAGIKNVKLIPVSPDEFPRPAKRPKYSILINTKLEPLRSWPYALEEFLHNQQEFFNAVSK
ncbi:MAG TPA: dTDP-4-dehydrorhamnose reductase [Syntrophorhabdaceae bacterium]|nr:dTDP-4-dehydrorhamnose reductase [Syntrophorhabdaceae bacterium]HPU29773.1 dTDP-4-dehydrorhamnose reductase [Syntrophorhabdaceae bacterium]